MYKKLELRDKQVSDIIASELIRQGEYVQLIASENFVSQDVLTASGSLLTNKYAEGYPGKRFYEGCEEADNIEKLAIERAKKLFGVEYVNVQTFSGSIANLTIYSALLSPGDKILGLDLKSGGHLSHGYRVSLSGKMYQSFSYSVDENGLLNYEDIKKIAKEVKPKMIICGFSSYSRIFEFSKFKEIADSVDALLLADISHIAGLVATKNHPSPVGFADVIMTTTHKTLRGPRGAIIMTNDKEIAKKIDQTVFPGMQGGASYNIIAAKAVAFGEALKPEFSEYSRQVIRNSRVFAEEFKLLGAKIVSETSDNHLFVVNVKDSYGISGASASNICKLINIIANKNLIPFDKESPSISSGLRLGTAAMTTRGFKEKEFKMLARIIHQALSEPENSQLHIFLKKQIKDLLALFPFNYLK